ncbi:MAG: formylglycine-generating enzyme family protein [Desulfobulbaceae bacterium]|nr:formylglycine-generating enzyme family protein [Desulfobulbaceae bacterium]
MKGASSSMTMTIRNPLLYFLLVGVAMFLFYDYTEAKTRSMNNRLCVDYSGLPGQEQETSGMVRIEGGAFIMGNDKGHQDKATGNHAVFAEEQGEHEVTLDGFWIDRHEVTNAQFSQFVKATSYKTVAERKPKKEWFPPGFPDDQMVAGSAVFVVPEQVTNMRNITQWWQFVEGANWQHPHGPGSDIKNKMNHPVVHVTYQDALAYAKWVGRELPTEAQWEYAARGGLKLATYAWGDSFLPNKQWMANTWQGKFPVKNSVEDGYLNTAPVGCYPPNGFGLYDLAGNVWEIVRDNYRHGHEQTKVKNPTGPERSFDPSEPRIAKHVIKGGSYLCAPDFCMRYRPAGRQPQDYTMGTSHVGFRTVVNVKNVKK